jgi:hypothetical protein
MDNRRAEICRRLAEGESLRAICRDEGMPSEATVRGWALADEGFSAQYARARELGYHALADEIVHISNTPQIGVKTKTNDKGEVETTEGDMIEHRRLQVDARKWFLSKVLPKVYGDRTVLAGDPDAPLNPRPLEGVPTAELTAALERLGIKA